MDMSKSIEPKSDQLNADDLLTGARVFTITEVTAGNAEQPFHFHYEGGEGRPWKPCKSMRRVIVRGWGADTKAYVGRSLQLFNDPSVKWGGQQVGGIRIAAMSHIESPFTINLTTTRGKRSIYKVEVLQVQQEDGLAAQLQASFDACATLDELRELWDKLPTAVKETAAGLKDEAKARLTGGQEGE